MEIKKLQHIEIGDSLFFETVLNKINSQLKFFKKYLRCDNCLYMVDKLYSQALDKHGFTKEAIDYLNSLEYLYKTKSVYDHPDRPLILLEGTDVRKIHIEVAKAKIVKKQLENNYLMDNIDFYKHYHYNFMEEYLQLNYDGENINLAINHMKKLIKDAELE